MLGLSNEIESLTDPSEVLAINLIASSDIFLFLYQQFF